MLNTERLIKALIDTELSAGQSRNPDNTGEKLPYVVTISRNHGAMGKEVAYVLAQRLGVDCCDRDILQDVARRAHTDIELVASLDRHIERLQGDWWRSLLDGKTLTRDQFYKNLVKVILRISQHGGVILGRGAHLILGPHNAFRVRIAGDASLCAQRIAERDGLEIKAAHKRVAEVDHERAEYIKVLYASDINDLVCYDIVINSDRFDVDAMVEVILLSMQKTGYALPEHSASPAMV